MKSNGIRRRPSQLELRLDWAADEFQQEDADLFSHLKQQLDDLATENRDLWHRLEEIERKAPHLFKRCTCPECRMTEN